MDKTFFCFGLGYSALALAETLKMAGWRIGGTCRSPEKRDAFRQKGWNVHLFDGSAPIDPSALAGVTHILASVPPEADDPVLRHHADDIAAAGAEWIGYLSTTGVYGDRDGGWVDETSDLTPTGARGERRKSAEEAWFALGTRSGSPVHTFRLAGIYGPDRNAP